MNTQQVVGEIQFSDVNVGVNVSSPYELVYNVDAITTSIFTIVKTIKKSRPFKRYWGGYLYQYLHDPIDDVTSNRIQIDLFDRIRQEEPRLKLDLVEVLPDYEKQAYYVGIDGYIPTLNNQTYSLSFNLKRVVT